MIKLRKVKFIKLLLKIIDIIKSRESFIYIVPFNIIMLLIGFGGGDLFQSFREYFINPRLKCTR